LRITRYSSSLSLPTSSIMFKRAIIPVLFLAFWSAFSASAQKKPPARYPSLFWEISGNGLTRPSYLFGTMHVSSKLAFHLSDSFYLALRNVDVVALELDPETWQGQIVRMNRLRDNYQAYIETPGDDYLTERSFRINDYTPELKQALSSQPALVNSLLYRTYKAREDFEEDTFLDLYIFQTGKKLGKRSAGVENYYETEKLIFEAYADMAMEKKKQAVDNDGESRSGIEEKLQDAYRRGDLDLMDSLDRMQETSQVFREKFLYQRNVIQANAMDSIMRRHSLFTGVGAAHLPGNRGVIELLRKKGYILRPIRMQDRDAVQREKINKMKVPVSFSKQVSDDGFYSAELPGNLFRQTEETQSLDRRQYADMANGAYYLVTRIKTHAAISGQSDSEVVKKVDSLLYENIPGKMISRKTVMRNGYPGFDVVNRTRRGDLQRNLILITPFEVLIFKMSGPDNYADGPESERFFSSISLRNREPATSDFKPEQGGFSVRFPEQPYACRNTATADGLDRWEYASVDKKTGSAFLMFRKSIYNFNFLEEDSFDLALMEESFHNPDLFTGKPERKPGLFNGYPCLDLKEQMKDSSTMMARFILQGPHYYLLAARCQTDAEARAFLNSFRIVPFNDNSPVEVTDSFMHFRVNSTVVPELDSGFRNLIERTNISMEARNISEGYAGYWPKARNALFKNPATGELIGVTIQEYPKYYYVEDSARFWEDELNDYLNKKDLFFGKIDTLHDSRFSKGFRFVLRDTGSSRTLVRQVVFNHQYYYSLVTMGDTLRSPGGFIEGFFNSFTPLGKVSRKSIYGNRLDDFFSDLFSPDTLICKIARQSISNVYYGEKGIPGILDAINRLQKTDKDYFESKTKLIAELGYIRDTLYHQVVPVLKKIYEQTADTSLFRNEVIRALARHKTKESYSLLKELLLQDPPVFESDYEYTGLFSSMEDSLDLGRQLFPELLQLLPVSDFKDRVQSLLVTLVDSNRISASDYETYFTKIYFDAKLEMRKQQAKDERVMQRENSKKEEEDDLNSNEISGGNASLDEYAVLLMPFYERNQQVRKYFERLLYSRDQTVQLNALIMLLKNRRPVPDSLLDRLAASDAYRWQLYYKLDKIGRAGQFPAAYRTQEAMARSLMLASKPYEKTDSVVFLYKQRSGYSGREGFVYFFKYRSGKETGWKIGISGLQPLDTVKIGTDDGLCRMTDKKLKPGEPVEEQCRKQLQRILFSYHKSAKNFYGYDDYASPVRMIDTYGD